MPQNPKLRALLGDLYEPVVHVAHDAIKKAYDDNMGEWFRPHVGNNNSTFGTSVHHSSVYNLTNMFRDALSDVIIQRPSNSLQIQLAATAMYVSKAGHRRDDKPDQFDFSNSEVRRRIAHANERLEMERLFEVSAQRTIVDPHGIEHYLMLAHCGNPFDGLGRLDIGLLRPHKKNQSPFYWHEPVYKSSVSVATTEQLVALERDDWNNKQVAELELPRKAVHVQPASVDMA